MTPDARPHVLTKNKQQKIHRRVHTPGYNYKIKQKKEKYLLMNGVTQVLIEIK